MLEEVGGVVDAIKKTDLLSVRKRNARTGRHSGKPMGSLRKRWSSPNDGKDRDSPAARGTCEEGVGKRRNNPSYNEKRTPAAILGGSTSRKTITLDIGNWQNRAAEISISEKA